MRSPLLLVLLLIAGAVVAYLSMSGGDPAPLRPPGASAGNDAEDVGGTDAPIVEMPRGVEATRSRPVSIEADVADAPTACLRVVDMADERPLPGALVRLVQSGADVAFSDEAGFADVPLKDTAQLAVVLEGYFLRLAPTQLGSTRAAPQVVRMVRDDWSIVRAFEFVDAQGNGVDDVFVRFTQPDTAERPAPRVPQDDPVRQRAWQEHTMLAPRAVGRDVHVQLVGYDDDRVHRLAARDLVRFTGAGTLTLEAATESGLVGRATVDVIAGPRPPAVRVEMTPGVLISGHVRDVAGEALADAAVSIEGDELLGLVATTGADGAFSIGPLHAGSATLLVRHGLHEPVAHGPVPAPSADVVVRLRALSRQPLRGRVLSRGSGAPIADAVVIWQAQGSDAVRARTAEDGTFTLRTVGAFAGTLRVQASGHVGYAELVEPTGPSIDYAVLPADRATRLQRGMTATLEGIVQNADGTPAPGVAVRWQPARATRPNVVPGRRILEGAVLELPLVTTTGNDGAFVLETTQFGGGQLSLVDDPDNAQQVDAIAGSSKNGLTFTR